MEYKVYNKQNIKHRHNKDTILDSNFVIQNLKAIY